MTRFPTALLATSMFGLLTLTPNIQAQETTDQSLADAAREQKVLRAPVKSARVYDNAAVEPATSSGSWKTDSRLSEAARPPAAPEGKAGAKNAGQPTRDAKRSSLDHRPDDHPDDRPDDLDTPDRSLKRSVLARSVLDHRIGEDGEDDLIVPEGTELKIEVPPVFESPVASYASRVVAPVRVGFATPIPALSAATVQVVARHTAYPQQRWPGHDTGYYEALEVTRVTVDGVVYGVQTDLVARPGIAISPTELTFRLTKPLAIRR